MQARNTYADPVQHHVQHLTSCLNLALALVGKAAMQAVQGHSLHSVASLGGSCAGSWPFCLFVSA